MHLYSHPSLYNGQHTGQKWLANVSSSSNQLCTISQQWHPGPVSPELHACSLRCPGMLQVFVLSTPKPDKALMHGAPPAMENFFVKELMSRITSNEKGVKHSMSRQASSRCDTRIGLTRLPQF